MQSQWGLTQICPSCTGSEHLSKHLGQQSLGKAAKGQGRPLPSGKAPSTKQNQARVLAESWRDGDTHRLRVCLVWSRMDGCCQWPVPKQQRLQGVCFHLYSKQRHEAMEEFQLPELQRTPLDEICLQVRVCVGWGDAVALDSASLWFIWHRQVCWDFSMSGNLLCR